MSDLNQRCSAETERCLAKGPFDGRSRSVYLGRFDCNATDERLFLELSPNCCAAFFPYSLFFLAPIN